MITVNVQGRLVMMSSPIQGGSMFDNAHETIEFIGLPTLDADQTVSLHWLAAEGGAYGSADTLMKTTNGYTYTVNDDMSQFPRVMAFIRITNGDEVWNTKSFYIALNRLPVIDGTVPGIPESNVIQQALDVLNQGIGDISSATSAAIDAADDATDAAETANDAADTANDAANAANDAADAANEAASNVFGMISPDTTTETTSTAAHDHAVGSYFIYDDELYITTVAISQGDTITPNTNCREVTVAEELMSIRSDMSYTPITISTFTVSPSQFERGDTPHNVNLSWSFNKTPTTLTLNGTTESTSSTGKSNVSTADSGTHSYSYVLSATDNGSATQSPATATRSVTVHWYYKLFYGAASIPGTLNSTFVRGLSGSKISSTRATTFSANAGSGQYIWYASPVEYGTPTFKFGANEVEFVLTGSIDVATADANVTASYYVYRSPEPNVGQTDIIVT